MDSRAGLCDPVVSVVITTRNRCAELRNALSSCFCQKGIDYEVLVYDDGSSDETSNMIRAEFPKVRLFSNSVSTGYIVLRNRGFRDARGAFVVSIDDDAWFTDPNTLSIAAKELERFPEAAALALCYTEPDRKEVQGFMPEVPTGGRLASYIGCAHMIRREMAIQLEGYREFLVHQGEERDLCIRLMEHGHAVLYANSPVIVHDPSPKRDFNRLAYLGVRNTLLFELLNVPLPFVLYRIPIDIALLFTHRLTCRQVPQRTFYILKAIFSVARHLPKRKAVSRKTYKNYRSLPMHGAVQNRFGIVSLRDNARNPQLRSQASE